MASWRVARVVYNPPWGQRVHQLLEAIPQKHEQDLANSFSKDCLVETVYQILLTTLFKLLSNLSSFSVGADTTSEVRRGVYDTWASYSPRVSG